MTRLFVQSLLQWACEGSRGDAVEGHKLREMLVDRRASCVVRCATCEDVLGGAGRLSAERMCGGMKQVYRAGENSRQGCRVKKGAEGHGGSQELSVDPGPEATRLT